MFKTVLFDWDGTLANSLELWIRTFQKVFGEIGIEASEMELRQAFFQTSSITKSFGGEQTTLIEGKLNFELEKWMGEIRLNDGVFDTLENIKSKDKKLGLVTTTHRFVVEKALKANQIYDFFDLVLGYEDVINHKPEPEIVFKAMDKIGGNKDEYLIIGDSSNDILAGQRAGIKTGFYFPKQNQEFYSLSENFSCGEDFKINELKEVLNIIDR